MEDDGSADVIVARQLSVLVGMACAVLLALGLAVFAGTLFAVEDDLESDIGQIGTARSNPIADEGIRTRIAESVLGVGDDRELLEAIWLIESGDQQDVSEEVILARHGEAIAKLTRLTAGEDDPGRRSAIFGLLGFVYADDARRDATAGARYTGLAIEAFQEAVLLDPENEPAKYNLELLLRREQAVAAQSGSESEGTGGTVGGAGFSEPGSGY